MNIQVHDWNLLVDILKFDGDDEFQESLRAWTILGHSSKFSYVISANYLN